jgi:hypothetical protein
MGGDDMEMDMQEPGEMCRRLATLHIPVIFMLSFIGVVGMHAIRIVTTIKSCAVSA